MFNFTSFDSVFAMAKMVGRTGLDMALTSRAVRGEDKNWITDFYNFAYRTQISLESYNDGNVNFEVVLYLNKDKNSAIGEVIFGEVVRTGFGAGTYTATEYFKADSDGMPHPQSSFILDHQKLAEGYRKALEGCYHN